MCEKTLRETLAPRYEGNTRLAATFRSKSFSHCVNHLKWWHQFTLFRASSKRSSQHRTPWSEGCRFSGHFAALSAAAPLTQNDRSKKEIRYGPRREKRHTAFRVLFYHCPSTNEWMHNLLIIWTYNILHYYKTYFFISWWLFFTLPR